MEKEKQLPNLYKKDMKKIVCYLAIIILLLGTHTSVLAKENNMGENGYIVSILRRYVNRGERKLSQVKVSQAFKIQGSDDRINMYLVSDGTHCIGELLIAEIGPNSFCSSYYELSNRQLDEMTRIGEPIAFFLDGDTIVFQCKNNAYCLGNEGEVNTVKTIDNMSINKVVFEEIPLSESGHSAHSRSGNSCHLYFPIIGNTSINGKGLCWAACSAMIGNFRTGVYRTATDLYYLLKNQYGGTPYGQSPWYQRAFRAYDLVYYELDGGTDFFSLLSILRWNRPIIFIVRLNWYSLTWHDIVLRGLDGGNDYAIYSFADPNYTSGYLYVQVSDVSGTSFPIVTNSGIYTIWKSTRY